MSDPHTASFWAVVMAGGQGTRFWPASRPDRPKQLLPLAPGGRSLLRATVERLHGLVPPERILVVTTSTIAEAVRAELPALPERNVLVEPVGRNTAPCIGWAARIVEHREPRGTMAVLPADHHIGDEETFRTTLHRALEHARRSGDLTTVGIRPHRPETGYGYIELGERIGEGVHRALRFVEKPDAQRAEAYLRAGRFLWNSGMFFLRVDALAAEVERQLPALHVGLERIASGEPIERVYPELPNVSIDVGIMEGARQVAVIPGEFGWSDVGSWASAWELAEHDDRGNGAPEGTVLIDCEGCLVRAPRGKVVALVGLRDVVVVDEGDALLIVPRERAQQVRQVVERLPARDEERR